MCRLLETPNLSVPTRHRVLSSCTTATRLPLPAPRPWHLPRCLSLFLPPDPWSVVVYPLPLQFETIAHAQHLMESGGDQHIQSLYYYRPWMYGPSLDFLSL